MTQADVPAVVRLHTALFHDTLTLLGEPLLEEFYRANLHEIALVASIDDAVVGFHLTVSGGRPSISRLLRNSRLPVIVGCVPRMLSNPRLAPRLVRALARRAPFHQSSGALALYTAVAPEAQGRGLAKLLLRRMVADAAARGLKTIEGEHEDDPRLHGLYESIGFRVRYGENQRGSAKLPAVLNVEEAARLLSSGPRAQLPQSSTPGSTG